jgi:UDP-N-acetylmuramate dehydrogenase
LANAITVTVGAGLAGLEPLVGIPGTVGGALHGNAGSHGGDIGQWACAATVISRSGEILQRDRGDLVFAYRQSSLDELVILSAEFELEEEDPVEVTKRLQKQWIVKKANLPMAHENTGCIFKNPRGMSAGMLIDQCGLKGESVGNVEVSQRHANFFIAKPGATAKDVLQLIDAVRNRVAERMGVELETEIEVW